jgi:IS5 family transposase
MDRAIPCKELSDVIAPFYPKAGNGRPPIGLERRLRIFFLQHWFNSSDSGAEEALDESRSMCRFVGIDLGKESVPEESTICKCRQLLKKASRRRQLSEAEQKQNRTKSRVRATVEHVFGVLKRVFGYTKRGYRGLTNNADAMFVTSALAKILWRGITYCGRSPPAAWGSPEVAG